KSRRAGRNSPNYLMLRSWLGSSRSTAAKRISPSPPAPKGRSVARNSKASTWMLATKTQTENSGEPDLRRAETKSLALLQRFSVETPAFDIEVLARVMGIEVREGGLEKADAW